MSDFKLSLMARPAASSPARLIRRPEESFSIDLLKAFVELARCRRVLIDDTFVLMRIPMVQFLPE